jgi:hypothetical protein
VLLEVLRQDARVGVVSAARAGRDDHAQLLVLVEPFALLSGGAHRDDAHQGGDAQGPECRVRS